VSKDAFIKETLAEIAALEDAARIAIDVPMGVEDFTSPIGRGCDTALRRELGQRQSSVFAVPARAALAEAREGLLAAGLEHETVDVDAGLAECAALEGDLATALRMTEDVIETANRLGHATALGDLHCLRGSLLLEQKQYPDAEQEFQLGLDSPDAGEGGCVRALNLLGRSLSRAGDGRPDEENLQAALAALRELGVKVLPHRLGHWVA